MSTCLELKKISDLEGISFWIPGYQRGYRWDKQQVNELLNDLWEFWNGKKNKAESYCYCLQPLVIIPLGDSDCNCWEVVDGQQRLTTISIIMQVFGIKEVPYTIEYETLGNNNDKIQNVRSVDENDSKRDINLHYMRQARECVENWKEVKKEKEPEIETTFQKNITEGTEFIWYQPDKDNAVKIFSRLNAGRIALSGAELIKALFLNSRNFRENSSQAQKVTQIEIAKQWDEIESLLQNDEFWLFFNPKRPEQPGTRIDFLLETVVKNNNYLNSIDKDKVGNDSYSIFRRYYEVYKENADDPVKFTEKWADVRKVFDTLTEWYNDSELYHYTGYLMAMGEKLQDLYTVWKETANDRRHFISLMACRINNKIRSCRDTLKEDKENDEDLKPHEAKPLLLLHNIVTVLRQNQALVNNADYQMGVFYKFPFHLFKIENWDVEHIDSATRNDLENPDERKIWLQSILDFCKHLITEELRGEIEEYLNPQDTKQNTKQDPFDALHDRLSDSEFIKFNDGSWKNKLKNYTLLDRNTNRGYKNAIFPVKRSLIVSKERGIVKTISWDKDQKKIKTTEKSSSSAFVAPCTKNVFQKTYTLLPSNFTEWTEDDADAYREDLREAIKYIDKIQNTPTPTQNK